MSYSDANIVYIFKTSEVDFNQMTHMQEKKKNKIAKSDIDGKRF